jgi:aminomethyltransferase
VGEGERVVGMVTSGTWSPTIRGAIALALVPQAMSAVGQALWVQVRKRRIPAQVVPLPFYRRVGPST